MVYYYSYFTDEAIETEKSDLFEGLEPRCQPMSTELERSGSSQ